MLKYRQDILTLAQSYTTVPNIIEVQSILVQLDNDLSGSSQDKKRRNSGNWLTSTGNSNIRLYANLYCPVSPEDILKKINTKWNQSIWFGTDP